MQNIKQENDMWYDFRRMLIREEWWRKRRTKINELGLILGQKTYIYEIFFCKKIMTKWKKKYKNIKVCSIRMGNSKLEQKCTDYYQKMTSIFSILKICTMTRIWRNKTNKWKKNIWIPRKWRSGIRGICGICDGMVSSCTKMDQEDFYDIEDLFDTMKKTNKIKDDT